MSFDRLAPHYDWLEALTAGRRLHQARTVWLPELAGCRRVLSLGEGHGRFAAACLARHPAVRLTCVESSAGMAAIAERRLRPWAGRVSWHGADVLSACPGTGYDAIVTCFFLDCFPSEALEAVIERAAGWLVPGGCWLNVDFAIPASGRWRRARAAAIHAVMYAFFRWVTALPARTLTEPDAFLGEHGFRLVRRREFEWGLIRADLWRR